MRCGSEESRYFRNAHSSAGTSPATATTWSWSRRRNARGLTCRSMPRRRTAEPLGSFRLGIVSGRRRMRAGVAMSAVSDRVHLRTSSPGLRVSGRCARPPPDALPPAPCHEFFGVRSVVVRWCGVLRLGTSGVDPRIEPPLLGFSCRSPLTAAPHERPMDTKSGIETGGRREVTRSHSRTRCKVVQTPASNAQGSSPGCRKRPAWPLLRRADGAAGRP